MLGLSWPIRAALLACLVDGRVQRRTATSAEGRAGDASTPTPPPTPIVSLEMPTTVKLSDEGPDATVDVHTVQWTAEHHQNRNCKIPCDAAKKFYDMWSPEVLLRWKRKFWKVQRKLRELPIPLQKEYESMFDKVRVHVLGDGEELGIKGKIEEYQSALEERQKAYALKLNNLKAEIMDAGKVLLEMKTNATEVLKDAGAAEMEGLLNAGRNLSGWFQTMLTVVDDRRKNYTLESLEELLNNTRQQQEDIVELGKGVAEEAKENIARFKVLREGMYVTRSEAKKQLEGLNGAAQELEGARMKATGAIRKWGPELESRSASIRNLISKLLQTVEMAQQRELAAVAKDEKAELKAAKKVANKKRLQWKSEDTQAHGTVMRALGSERVAAKKRQMQLLTRQDTTLIGLDRLSRNAKDAGSKATQLSADLTEDLRTLADNAEDTVRSAVADFESGSLRWKASTHGALTMLKKGIESFSGTVKNNMDETVRDTFRDINTDIRDTSQELLEKATELRGSFGDMQESKRRNVQRMGELVASLPEITTEAKALAENVVEELNRLGADFESKVDEERKSVERTGDEFDKDAKESTDVARKLASDRLAKFSSETEQSLSKAAAEVGTETRKVDRQITTDGANAKGIIRGMEKLVKDVSEVKEGVDATEKAKMKKIGEAKQAVKKGVSDAETALSRTTRAVKKVIAKEESAMSQLASDELRSTKERVATRFSDGKSKNTELLTASKEEAETEEAESAKSAEEQKAERRKIDSLVKQLQTTLGDTASSSREWKDDLGKQVQQLKREVRDSEKQRVGGVVEARRALGDETQQRVKKALGALGESATKFFSRQSDAIAGDVNAARSSLNKEERGLEDFATASEKKLNGLKGDAQAVDALLAQAAAAADVKAAKETSAAKRFAAEESSLQDASAAAKKAYEDRIGEVAGQLDAEVGERERAFRSAAYSERAKLSADAEVAAGEAAEAERTGVAAAGAAVADFEARAERLGGAARDAAERTHKNVEEAESEEANAAGAVNGEANKLEKELKVGERQVEAAKQDEEKKQASAVTENVDGIEGVFGGVQAEEGAAAEQVEGVGVTTEKELAKQRDQSAGFSSQTRTQLTKMKATSVNLTASLEEGAQANTQSLASAGAHFRNSSEQTVAAMAALNAAVAQQRAERERVAAEVQASATRFRENGVGAITGEVTRLEAGKGEVRAGLSDLAARQRALDDSFLKIEGFKNEGSDEVLDAVVNVSQRLEAAAARNLDWQFRFKHRTRAWRAEVEKRLKQLGVELEQQENAEGSARVDEDARLGETLRGVDRAAAGTLTDLSAAQAAQMNGAVARFDTQMAEAQGDEAESAAAEEASLQQATGSLTAGEEGAARTVANLADREQAVQQEAGRFAAEMASRGAQIEGQLQQGSASLDGGAATAEQKLRSRLARMSLLQTESGSSTSRSALLALRDALRSSNAHLRADDAGLERQADALGALLHGLPSFLRGR